MRIQIVGRGRMGTALASALRAARVEVDLVAGRGEGSIAPSYDVVLLAVPDAAIEGVARRIAPGPLVGHCSGATGLAALAPHEAFSVHPLLTVTDEHADFAGAHAAIDGASTDALEVAQRIAELLHLTAFRVADADRAAYHAAASVASNFLVTVEGFAADLAATAGVPREALAPLVRAAVENWAEVGAPAALTGPIARGDHDTVARQRAAVADRLPDQLDLFDALTAHTERLAARRDAA